MEKLKSSGAYCTATKWELLLQSDTRLQVGRKPNAELRNKILRIQSEHLVARITDVAAIKAFAYH